MTNKGKNNENTFFFICTPNGTPIQDDVGGLSAEKSSILSHPKYPHIS